MPTSWPTSNDPLTGAATARTDFAADKPCITFRVDVLHDQIVTLGERGWQVHQAEAARSAAGYATYATKVLWVPDYAANGRNLIVYLDAKVDAGSGQWRIKDNGSGTASAAVAVTQTAYTAISGPATLAMDSTWADTKRTILVEFDPNTAGTITLRSVDLLGWYYED